MIITVLEHPRIRSEKHFNDIANTPLWSCLVGGYAAAALQQGGHEVRFLDAANESWDFERAEEQLLASSPDMLCVNAVYFWENTPKFFDFLHQLRAAGFGGHINLFGFFPTLAYEVILKAYPAIDSIAVGECENTLVELANRLSKRTEWRDIPGLASATAEGIILSAKREPEENPDKFPFPLRDPKSLDPASILASRGCYNHCTFCPVPVYYNGGSLWRGRSPGNVIQEIIGLMEQGVRDFYFVDPNFIGPGHKGKARTMELARMMAPLGITFGMETRPEDLDEEIMGALTAAGLQSLLMGIESGSPSMLGRIHKRTDLQASEKAIALCRTFGIDPQIGFLMFLPDSTIDDLENNFRFLESNNLLDKLERTANLLGHRQIVFMGTSDYGRFKSQGRIKSTGPLDFQGEISFMDNRVEWMAELVIHACLSILRDMSSADSSRCWQNDQDGPEFKRANSYLLDLFERLLKMARKSHLPHVKEVKQDIALELQEDFHIGENSLRVEEKNSAQASVEVTDRLSIRTIRNT